MEEKTMTPEERKQKEDELKRLRDVADAAHQAAADKPGNTAAQKKAEQAEDAYNELKAELDAAPLEESHEDDEEEEEDEEEQDVDFGKDLEELEGKPAPKGPTPAKTELEKAERNLFFNAERVRKLGGDPTKVLKPKADDTEEEAPPAPPAPAKDEADPRYVTVEHLAEQEAAKLSSTEAQRKVIMWHYKHSIARTGNVISDIENAFFIANKGRIRRSIDEIRRAKNALPAPGNGPGRRIPAKDTRAPQLSSGEQATLRRRGFKQNADGAWEAKRYIMRFVTGKGWVTERKQ